MATRALRLNTDTELVERTPELVEVADTALAAAAAKVPRGRGDGTLDPSWISDVPIAALPVALPGETSAEKVARADDPRLTGRGWSLRASETLYAGTAVTAQAGETCGLASAAATTTAAIGFITESYGQGQQAQIWPFGEVDVPLAGLTDDAIQRPVYLATTPGQVSLAMPALVAGHILQTLGTVVGIVSPTVARVAISIGPYEEVV